MIKMVLVKIQKGAVIMTKYQKGIEISTRRVGGRDLVSRGGIELKYDSQPLNEVYEASGYVYLVVDCSGSMAGDKLIQAKKGALNFAKDALARGYSTGLIQFHSSSKVICELANDVRALENKLNNIELGDTTHMADAIRLAYKELKGMRGNLSIVIVTDGIPNGPGDPQSTLAAGKIAKNDGIDIITIGTDDADYAFLKQLASRSELSTKVSRDSLAKAIASASKLLPAPRNK
jgi:Mg-chelatase subunit ChlD